MAPRVVRSGEHLDVIAYRHGVTPDEVWNASANRTVRSLRPGGHMLLPGDLIELPARKHPEPVDLTIGAETTIVATIPKVRVELVLMANQKPLVGERWHIEALGEKAKGATGTDGKVSFEVRVTTTRVVLVLESSGQRRDIVVGGLDPIDATSGVAHRLRNMGFDTGPAAGGMTPRLREAIARFQTLNDLAPTGEPDTETLALLRAKHGS